MSGYQRKRFLNAAVILISGLMYMSQARADIKLDIVSTITGGTCKVGISDGAVIVLDTVSPSSLDGVGPEDDAAGGKMFSLTVEACDVNAVSSGSGYLSIRFSPAGGAWAGDTFQVLPNEISVAQNGAGNVGFALFSIKDPANIFNVQMANNGGTAARHPINKTDLIGSRYPFYVRYQKINNAMPGTSGVLFSQAVVEVFYE
ncbi:type 1 fimbria pilin [Klebsiella oxytoca]|uniref:Type 1 fimbria pilin n=1 Tax=Klebsiella oxytoca TaxID=571 RepID=A0A318FD31_KLEOX|nr:fimbrial-like protein [Klebsiella oxytoca]PXW39030.1 type 1 fimbria pilin [Klebsiella oxytoca]